MEELTPINSIPVNFGKGIDFSPPSTDGYLERLSKEAVDADGDAYRLYEADRNLWSKSASRSDLDALAELDNQIDETEKAHFEADGEKVEPTRILLNVLRERRYKLLYSSGKHICGECFFCYFSEVPPFKNLFTCERNGKPRAVLVRPFSEGCPKFEKDPPQSVLDRIQEIERKNRYNKEFMDFKTYSLRMHNLRTIIGLIQSNPSSAFFLYRTSPEYYKKLFAEFPDELKKTEYGTLEKFEEAYKEWEEDVIIKKDGNTVTISVSNEKLVGKDSNKVEECK